MFVPAVSQSIQAINEAVEQGEPAQTLAALRSPGAGLYGVTSECAQTYQDDLTKIKTLRWVSQDKLSQTATPTQSRALTHC